MFAFKKVFHVLVILMVITCLSSTVFGKELLPEKIAEELGISADIAERFELVYEYEPTEENRKRPNEEYTRIITNVSYAHLGGDSHIWRIQFVEGYSVAGHLVRLYLDTDNDMTTGRQHKNPDGSLADWQGVDEMVTLNNIENGWAESWRHFFAGGNDTYYSLLPKFVADGNVVYCLYQIPTNKEGDSLIFRARVVSQIPGKVVNSTPWLQIKAKAF